MARGDSIFGRVDVDWHTGERTLHLRPAERDFYLIGFWLYAVKIRRDVIPGHMCSSGLLSSRCQVSVNTCKRIVSKLDDIGLITVNPDNSIKVHGVKEMHQRIAWREDTPTVPVRGNEPSPYVPHNDDEKHIHRRGTCKTPLGNSPNTKTSSAFDHQGARNPEVSPKGTEQDPISTLEDFQKARPTSIEKVHEIAFEVISSLRLPDEISSEVEDIVAGYPVVWTRDAMLTTRDKQLRILEGTDKTGFTSGPLEYLAASLEKKLHALKRNLDDYP